MNLSLYHLVKEPKIKKEKNPLLLLLHGYGSNEEDLFSFASELPDHYYIISARAPYNLMPNAYAWYAINFDADENKFSDLDQARSSRETIVHFIDELVENYAIDPNKITLIGFSQGCILSYATALSYPNKIQRIVGMSGYFNQEIALKDYQKNNFNNLQIFASHGSVDQVVPVEWARKAQPILNDLGIKNSYKEYPVGHGVAPQNFYDFKNWLLETE
ncbi:MULTISPECIES: alpha/beta hydrolase [Flavobacterium]|uniref:Alpha/beta fold hydrolase n=2 Tax=Flavobacterium TaxID=237 RepID=A0A2N9PBQ6_9FLAO|nr:MULTISPECIES: alpha/beta fold hydrolase [Flavobacterium]OWP83174.1 phospholipase [Flavobacterium davisii]RVU91858.1 alpha/beta fold hydrolase [Flavobacterium columnare]SPE77761.1 Carboxylesterase 2 [Flavobacterium columnare]